MDTHEEKSAGTGQGPLATADSPVAGLSCYIICKDAEATIRRCVESAAFCSEIVVVINDSTDQTRALLDGLADAGLPVRVIEKDWMGFAAQKQFALDACAGPWCLNLDADEWVDDELRAAIIAAVLAEDGPDGYRLRRREWLPGYGFVHPGVRHRSYLRLSRKTATSYDLSEQVHETVRVDGSTQKLEAGFIWHEQLLTPQEIVAKQNRYSDLKAAERVNSGRRPNATRMLTAPVGYFFKRYVMQRYFLCGWSGFAAAMVMASYAFQTEWKHWLKWRDDPQA